MNSIAKVKNMYSKKVFILLLFLPLIFLSMPGCGGGSPSPEIKAQLSFSEPPVLGKQVTLTATFVLTASAYPKASNVKAEIVLPEGIQRIDGDLKLERDFLNGQTYEIKTTVKAIKTGLWEVVANAFFSPREGDYLGGTKELWVSVSENGATVSDVPGHPSGTATIPATGTTPSARTNSPEITVTQTLLFRLIFILT